MKKPKIPKLKIITRRNCESVLDLYKTFSKKEILQKEKFYIQKIQQEISRQSNCMHQIC